jgi:hypothetical protein
MNKSLVQTALSATLLILIMALLWAPQPALAQRGGHGGGGWHSGGGGWGHGGYYPVRGGYGWGRGYWGYPRYGYGYGWGFGVRFGWGPFWGGFGYPYGGYGWAPSYYPYYYPYSYPFPYYVPATPASYVNSSNSNNNDYGYSSEQRSDYVPDGSSSQYQAPSYQYSAPAQQYRAPALRVAPATNSVTLRDASYTSGPSRYPTHTLNGASNHYRSGNTGRQLPPLRPEVQNVVRALQAMPPYARERQIDSGRYGNLSPNEIEIVRYAAGLSWTW